MLARGLKTVAIPPLGCGLGGLSWNIVEPMILKEFAQSGIEVRLYPPQAPTAHPAPRPAMTP
jgi:hypothetical protein